MPRKWAHIRPFWLFPITQRRRREDLQPAQTVEKQCERAEVGMLPESGAGIGRGLWRGFDEADLISRWLLELVKSWQRAGTEIEMAIQVLEEE